MNMCDIIYLLAT